jgi:hypothetical protein
MRQTKVTKSWVSFIPCLDGGLLLDSLGALGRGSALTADA